MRTERNIIDECVDILAMDYKQRQSTGEPEEDVKHIVGDLLGAAELVTIMKSEPIKIDLDCIGAMQERAKILMATAMSIAAKCLIVEAEINEML